LAEVLLSYKWLCDTARCETAQKHVKNLPLFQDFFEKSSKTIAVTTENWFCLQRRLHFAIIGNSFSGPLHLTMKVKRETSD
jgi:hypothetical protein